MGDPPIIVCLDETGDRKKGHTTDYVAPRYIGNLHGTANGAVSVNAHGVLGTTYLKTNLLGKIERSVDNMFGLRTWIEYSFKHAKDELGWANYRLTDAHRIEQWWELIMSAYTLVTPQRRARASQHDK